MLLPFCTLFLVVMLISGNCKWIGPVHQLKCQVAVREGWRARENCQESRLCYIISQGNPCLFEPKARTIYCQAKYQLIMVLSGSRLLKVRFTRCFFFFNEIYNKFLCCQECTKIRTVKLFDQWWGSLQLHNICPPPPLSSHSLFY